MTCAHVRCAHRKNRSLINPWLKLPPPDLLVMGTHSKGRLASTVSIGALARHLLIEASADVMTSRGLDCYGVETLATDKNGNCTMGDDAQRLTPEN